MDRIRLPGLDPDEYEHPFDRQALQALERTPGLPFLVKKLSEYTVERALRIQYVGSNLRVGETMLPHLHAMLLEVCSTLDLQPAPALYVALNPFINAFTAGVKNPLIVLHSASVDYLSEDELLFIIAHEVGHIKSEHVLYHQMAMALPILGRIAGAATLGAGALVSAGLQMALLHWQRMSEFTADRAGLLACQDAKVAASAFMKTAGLPTRCYHDADVAAFVQQARDFDQLDFDALDKIIKVLQTTSLDHPWTVTRAAELLRWIDVGDYGTLLTTYGGLAAAPKQQTSSTTPLWPCYVLVDCSQAAASVGIRMGEAISKLLRTLRTAAVSDLSPAVSFVECHDTGPKVTPLRQLFQLPALGMSCGGQPVLGPSLLELTKAIDGMTATTRGKALVILALMDEPSDNFGAAAGRLRQLQAQGRANVVAVGVGSAASDATLRQLASIALRVDDPYGAQVRDCFEWLGHLGAGMLTSLGQSGQAGPVRASPLPAGVRNLN